MRQILKQPESNFDRDDYRNGFSAGTIGGLEAPLLHGFHRFFFQTKPRTLDDLNFRGAAIWSDHRLKDDRALILCLAGLFGIFRVRAINAGRIADAACPRMIRSAARTASGTRPQAAA